MKWIASVSLGTFLLACGAVLYSQGGAVEHGKEVYAMQKCSFCHSTDGGDKESLAGVGARLKPEEIRKWVQAPKTMKSDTRMKAYPNLPAKDLDGLVAYLGTLK